MSHHNRAVLYFTIATMDLLCNVAKVSWEKLVALHSTPKGRPKENAHGRYQHITIRWVERKNIIVFMLYCFVLCFSPREYICFFCLSVCLRGEVETKVRDFMEGGLIIPVRIVGVGENKSVNYDFIVLTYVILSQPLMLCFFFSGYSLSFLSSPWHFHTIFYSVSVSLVRLEAI